MGNHPVIFVESLIINRPQSTHTTPMMSSLLMTSWSYTLKEREGEGERDRETKRETKRESKREKERESERERERERKKERDKVTKRK